MAGLGSFSGGATLQRSKLDLSQKQSQAREIKTDDGQGGGIGGKGNINGGKHTAGHMCQRAVITKLCLTSQLV
jgi:hypothetical protein